ncbi:hypothetical protein AERO_08170 [Aeromicrobium fastidiosum]|uniref:hypothetical protein n=1 Tax=Aeromicrobium fastidiosum TaxID=52699 RepID=UPI00202380F3|nr:hypothetical protein [Aeromicrobium fastidiosum]MCL8251357.1 hypothetical protein [Aeromicrobium fastidiosum]
MPNVSFFSFNPDSRANRIERFLVTQRTDLPEDPRRWLNVRGPSEAMTQIDLVAGARGVAVEVPATRAKDFNYRRSFKQGLPPEIRTTAKLLREVLTMTAREHLDFAIALDWYKIPDPDVEANNWRNTDVGELVNRSKYRESRASAIQLVDKIQEIVETHPLLKRAEYLATVPGHNADGKSFGERLARTIAKRTGKTIMQTTCPSGRRDQQKSGQAPSLDGLFEMPQTLWGEVVIIDDVYKSGATMNAVGLAARQAGADHVYGLAAVRTMRK